jgi:hypothetical protein
MKLIKILTAFIALASLQIAAAQWLNVPPPAEAKNLMVFTAGVPVVAGSGIEVIGTPAGATGAPGTTLTFAATVPATGSNRVLVVGAGGYYYGSASSKDVTGVTYNSQALTQFGTQSEINSGNNNFVSSLWFLANPSTGSSYNVVITWSGSADAPQGTAVAFSGVNQTTPFRGSIAKATGTSTTPSVNVSSASGDIVIDFVTATSAGGNIAPGANQIQQYETADSSLSSAASTEAGAATVTMSWTSDNDIWTISGGSLQVP